MKAKHNVKTVDPRIINLDIIADKVRRNLEGFEPFDFEKVTLFNANNMKEHLVGGICSSIEMSLHRAPEVKQMLIDSPIDESALYIINMAMNVISELATFGTDGFSGLSEMVAKIAFMIGTNGSYHDAKRFTKWSEDMIKNYPGEIAYVCGFLYGLIDECVNDLFSNYESYDWNAYKLFKIFLNKVENIDLSTYHEIAKLALEKEVNGIIERAMERTKEVVSMYNSGMWGVTPIESTLVQIEDSCYMEIVMDAKMEIMKAYDGGKQKKLGKVKKAINNIIDAIINDDTMRKLRDIVKTPVTDAIGKAMEKVKALKPAKKEVKTLRALKTIKDAQEDAVKEEA